MRKKIYILWSVAQFLTFSHKIPAILSLPRWPFVPPARLFIATQWLFIAFGDGCLFARFACVRPFEPAARENINTLALGFAAAPGGK
ncbi:hypothetical protein [Idiomarina aquatica]|uniref:Uncharacterized protein n=1 Tax=Idiomarina aquatica TaxID=1327752 RepID=A0AA94EGM0_9GAMM|nr:hypothetical protein [Idiomarina aquatica]RUO45430.1 hypothetical protein CWE23_05370 [Idiomarina aquatica]